MQRWTLPSRAERGRVILSGAWTTSTCYKPREIERIGFGARIPEWVLTFAALVVIHWIELTLPAHGEAHAESHTRPYRHPKYKTAYHVNNWREYEQSLRDRGDITLWISAEA